MTIELGKGQSSVSGVVVSYANVLGTADPDKIREIPVGCGWPLVADVDRIAIAYSK